MKVKESCGKISAVVKIEEHKEAMDQLKLLHGAKKENEKDVQNIMVPLKILEFKGDHAQPF